MKTTQYLSFLLLPLAVLAAPVPQDTTAPAGNLTAATGNITDAAEQAGLTALENSQGNGQVQAADADASGACTDMMVVFARGTTETGTVGTLAGPPFFDALTKAIAPATMSAQGVPYPADIPGFLAGGDPTGSKTMATMITDTMAKCPNAKVVMSGYSQGGQLVHNAAKTLPAATMQKVSSVVIFGDPDNGEAVQGASASATKVICHVGDNICAHGDLILAPHLTYSMDAGTAAAFSKQAAGL